MYLSLKVEYSQGLINVIGINVVYLCWFIKWLDRLAAGWETCVDGIFGVNAKTENIEKFKVDIWCKQDNYFTFSYFPENESKYLL